MTKKNSFKNVFKIKEKKLGFGKRVLLRSGFVAGGITLGAGAGLLTGNPMGLLAGTSSGVVAGQHLATRYMQGKFPHKPKRKKKVKH